MAGGIGAAAGRGAGTRKAIHAVYENEVFRPTGRVDLPEGSEVTVELMRADESTSASLHQRRIFALLSQPDDTGDPGLSA